MKFYSTKEKNSEKSVTLWNVDDNNKFIGNTLIEWKLDILDEPINEVHWIKVTSFGDNFQMLSVVAQLLNDLSEPTYDNLTHEFDALGYKKFDVPL